MAWEGKQPFAIEQVLIVVQLLALFQQQWRHVGYHLVQMVREGKRPFVIQQALIVVRLLALFQRLQRRVE